MSEIRGHDEYDLKELLGSLTTAQINIDEIYLFGSRAYATGSLRSDCDLLVRPTPGRNVRSSDLRDFAQTNCEALDFFLVEGGTARSCSNDSYVHAESFEQLSARLDAVLLWKRSEGFTNFSFGEDGWSFRTASSATFHMTVLPDAYIGEQAWLRKIASVERSGLPVRPYIGDTLKKAVVFIQEITRGIILRPEDLGQRGQAKSGWTVNLNDEYDCQNLFFTVVKPWLPGLSREEVAICYDDQDKRSDFSLFEGKLIIEMKFIKDNASKSTVVKTLEGLSSFYIRNNNIGCLLIIVYVKAGVDIDKTKWESDFTHANRAPSVITMVVKVP